MKGDPMRFPSFVDVSRVGREIPNARLILAAIRYIAEREGINDPEAYELLVKRAEDPDKEM